MYYVEIHHKEMNTDFWNKEFKTLKLAKEYARDLRKTQEKTTVINSLKRLTVERLNYFVMGVLYAHIGTFATITIRKGMLVKYPYIRLDSIKVKK